MSYCRFSTDDYQCDVYVYASEEGWNVWLAHDRCVFKVPLPDPVSVVDIYGYAARSLEIGSMIADPTKVDRVPLPKSSDGEDMWIHDTPGECAENLQRLASEGFNVPQRAIDALKEEQHDIDGCNFMPGEQCQACGNLHHYCNECGSQEDVCELA